MSTISIEYPEGTVVFTGTGPDGDSRWRFFKRLDNGKLVPARRIPKRIARLMSPKKENIGG